MIGTKRDKEICEVCKEVECEEGVLVCDGCVEERMGDGSMIDFMLGKVINEQVLISQGKKVVKKGGLTSISGVLEK